MRPTTYLRLAVVGGRSDVLRIALTAVGAALGALAVLTAATVLSIPGSGTAGELAPYSSPLLAEPGLRPGVATGLLLLCIPVLFFVGQCARVGAPVRDRRLAAIRMAGATPRQAAALAVTETAVATLFGVAVGVGGYLVGRVLLDEPARPVFGYGTPSAPDVRPLPTDVLPAGWVFALVLVGLPLVAAGLATVALRRVAFTPFGVMRRQRVRPPRALPAVLFGVGVGGLLAFGPVLTWLEPWVEVAAAVMLVLTLLAASGLVLGTAAVSAALGRLVAGRARRPAVLIAGRRLAADPWASSRSLAALLVAVFVGAGVLGVRAVFVSQSEISAEAHGEPPDPFYADAFDVVQLAVWAAVLIAAAGLLVAAVEQVLERRRTLAALVAQGTPRGVLARAATLQVALVVVPGVALAALAGAFAARGVFGDTVQSSASGTCVPPADAPADWCHDPSHVVWEQARVRAAPVPWDDVAVLGVGAVLATLAVTAVGLLLLRRATDVTELRAAA